MKIINPKVELINPPDYKTMLKTVEAAGRTCYKSEGKIKDESAEPFVRGIIKRGHEAVIEHTSITIRFTCDRGVSHEIVRHRLASYCQESTRYCNYSKGDFEHEITVVKPVNIYPGGNAEKVWLKACENAERAYFDLLDSDCTPQVARAVLPTCLKTELVMTANVREWRHFIKQRYSKAAHPDMREIARQLYELLAQHYPAFFEDLGDNNDVC